MPKLYCIALLHIAFLGPSGPLVRFKSQLYVTQVFNVEESYSEFERSAFSSCKQDTSRNWEIRANAFAYRRSGTTCTVCRWKRISSLHTSLIFIHKSLCGQLPPYLQTLTLKDLRPPHIRAFGRMIGKETSLVVDSDSLTVKSILTRTEKRVSR